MIKKNTLILITILILLSLSIYSIQIKIFNQESNTLFYLFQDLAFVPIQVLLVTLLLNRLLNIMELRKKTKKINVIISTFFVETGTELLTEMAGLNNNNDEIYKIMKKPRKDHGRSLKKDLDNLNYDLIITEENILNLSSLLKTYRSFMLNMLGNDNLLEHDSFTDMLWAVFHVADELKTRLGDEPLTNEDISHLKIDIKRAYSAMLNEWANYMDYLKTEYPFLYVLAIKKAKGVILD